MADITPIALVHYHEIGLKGHNRTAFEKRLQKNLQALLHDGPVTKITRISGRILIEFTIAQGLEIKGEGDGEGERSLTISPSGCVAADATAADGDATAVGDSQVAPAGARATVDPQVAPAGALASSGSQVAPAGVRAGGDATAGGDLPVAPAGALASGDSAGASAALPAGVLPAGTFTATSTPKAILDVCEFVSRVPGVARVSCGYRCERDIDVMCEVAARALSEAGDFDTFKVHARRAHTDFAIDSMQMNQIIGAALCASQPDRAVRMKDPDVTVGVEVIQGATYIYARSIRGIGGLPVGASGKVACLLSSGIDSPVATWKMARRGATCIGVHFSGRPQTSDASEYLVDDIAHVLARTGCISKVYTFGIGDYQREISLKCPPALRVILYRRLMFRVACAIAAREKCGAIATGESLGQVASQTLDNINCTNAVADRPVLRPLIGTDKLEIIAEAQALGTFDISTQDAPDCCTLFMPRSPETHGKLPDVEAAEAALPIDEWVQEILDSAEIKTYK